jgi:hypothetical protein
MPEAAHLQKDNRFTARRGESATSIEKEVCSGKLEMEETEEGSIIGKTNLRMYIRQADTAKEEAVKMSTSRSVFS